MKNFRKVLVLLFVAVFALVLVGCGDKKPAEKTDLDILNEKADKLYLGKIDAVNSDLKLPKFVLGDKEYTVTWTSDNETSIKIEEYEKEEDKAANFRGHVTIGKEQVVVKLTATIKYKELTVTREFNVTVVKDESVVYNTILEAKKAEGKEKDKSKVQFSGVVSAATKSGFVVSDESANFYVYKSNHGQEIGNKVTVNGPWTYYNNMVQIGKGAAVTVDGKDAAFDLAKYAETKTLEEIAAIAPKEVDDVNSTKIFKTVFGVSANPAGSYNTYKLQDPKNNEAIVDLSKYNDMETIDKAAELAASGKFYEGYIILYCSRDYKNGLWDALLLADTVVEKEVELTTEQKKNQVANDLNAQFGGKIVAGDLKLPASNEKFGATITWASSDTAIIGNDGKLTTPDTLTEVKLTATIVIDGQTFTEEYTVKATKVSEISAVKAAEKGALMATEGYVVAVDAKEFIINDKTGNILVYCNNAPKVALGDKVLVGGEKSIYNNAPQLKNVSYEVLKDGKTSYPVAKEFNASVFDVISKAETIDAELYIASGKLTVKDGRYYVAVEGVKDPIQIINVANKAALDKLLNKDVVVSGYITGYNSRFFDVPMVLVHIGQLSTVKDVRTAEKGTYAVKGTVVAINVRSFVLEQDGARTLVYNDYAWRKNVKIGDQLLLIGATTVYNKGFQFGNKPAASNYAITGNAPLTAGTPEVLDGAKITEMVKAEVLDVKLVEVTGVLTVNKGKYFEIAVGDAKAEIAYPENTNDLKALNGKTIKVTGYATSYGYSKLSIVAISTVEVK